MGINMSSTISEKVIKIVAKELDIEEADVKLESTFVDDLGADSLASVEVMMALEEEFNIDIPDEDAEKINSVQQVVDYIAQAIGEQATS